MKEFVRTDVAYGLFFAAVASVTLIAIIWPFAAKKVKSYLHPGEDFTSARNTQPWYGIVCSFYSSSLGGWVLTAPPEIAQAYGLWGIIGYAMAVSLPWVGVAFLGPRMRRLTDGKGFSHVDFVLRRLGRINHLIYSLVAFATVFLGYIVECISLSTIIKAISTNVQGPVLTSTIAVCVFLYTCISGLQATLLTDRLQLVAISILICLASFAVFRLAVNELEDAQGSEVIANQMQWTTDGFVSLLVLNISCFYPTFMDPASWSRMYAARSENDAKYGLLGAAGALIIPMILFGFMGLVSGAAYSVGAVKDSSIFSTLTLINPAWNCCMLILATLLSVSTVDTLSSSITTFIIANFAACGRPVNVNYARIGTLLVTVIGLVLIIQNPPAVMTIFMTCNLLTTCTTGGLLLSLWDIVSPLGVTLGVVCAALSVCTFGWVRLGTFKGGFDWWLLPEGSANLTALYTFIICGAMSLVTTIGVSHLEFYLNSSKREEQRQLLASLRDDEGEVEKLLEDERKSSWATVEQQLA